MALLGQITEDVSYRSMDDAEALYKDGFVTVSWQKFTTNLQIFYALIHEGMHAWDEHNGVYEKFGYNLSEYGYARTVTEVRAYQMQMWFGGTLKGRQISYYESCLKLAKQSGAKNFEIKSYPKFFEAISKPK